MGTNERELLNLDISKNCLVNSATVFLIPGFLTQKLLASQIV